MAYKTKGEKEQEILALFYERLGRFINSSAVSQWRGELRTNYRAIASDQWNFEDYEKRERRKKPITTFNNTSSLIRCISGYEIVNRSRIDYYPRLPSPENNNQVDMISDVVEYIQDDSGFFSESSEATGDVLICGLGATVSEFDYYNSAATYGEMVEKRIFPGYMMYDNQVRGRRLNREANWAGYIQLVPTDWLDKELEGKTPYNYSGAAGTSAQTLINFWDAYSLNDNVEIMYMYEWREAEKIYRVKNPFTEEMLNDARPLSQDVPDTIGDFIGAAAQQLSEELGAPLEKGVFVLDSAQYKEYRNALSGLTEITGIPFETEAESGERYKYYQARIARGCIIDWRESWCQTRFTITYKTGYFDERKGCFYGVMRDMLPVQQALNTAVSDYISYLESIPKGGQEIEIDAVADIKEYIKSRVNEQDVTVYQPGGLDKSRVKQTPQPIGGLSEFIAFCKEQLAAVVGLTADFVGSVESGNMSALLFGKIVRQSRLVLAPIMDSNVDYLKCKGSVYLDGAKVLIENSNGMILRRMSGSKSEQDYTSISTDALSGEYDIVVTDKPMTDDERQERFNAMIELYGRAQNPALLMLAIEDAPIDQEQKDKALALMQPAPPAPPNPLDIALMESQIKLQNAQADKLIAEAQSTMKTIELADDNALADIRKKTSAAELDDARTKAELAGIADTIMQRIAESERAAAEKMQALIEQNSMIMNQLNQRTTPL